MDWQAWYTLGIICAMAFALVRGLTRPDLILLTSLGMLLLAGIITPENAFTGFSNTAVLAIGALFIVAAGVQRTGAFRFVEEILFPNTRRMVRILFRMMVSTSFLSAFLNNTPIVAMLIPSTQEWSRKTGISSSKLLIPLSYAAIAGGLITLIGTSTTIVVSGLMVTYGYPGFTMFELSWIGIPAVLALVLYILTFGRFLLPERKKELASSENGLTDYLFELRVAEDSPLVGKTVEEAKLRALIEAFLIHIRRRSDIIEPSSPDIVLQAGDILTFSGNAVALDRLLNRPGLERVLPFAEKGIRTLPLFEAVVAPTSRLIGHTLREVRFRERYQGVVLAIQRSERRFSSALGQTPIQEGDLLLIEARDGFDHRWNANREEFYLVAPRQRRPATRYKRAPLALFILLFMVVAITTSFLSLVTATFSAALAMILSGCLRPQEAGRSIDLSVLVIIAAALGIGQAVEQTGLAALTAQKIISISSAFGPLWVLVGLYIMTNILTELITHKAAAVLMLPVGLAAAADMGIDPKATAIIITVAAAASFMTPIGYQTNLMVMSAGGYRFSDYLRIGFPFSVIMMFLAVFVVNWVWL